MSHQQSSMSHELPSMSHQQPLMSHQQSSMSQQQPPMMYQQVSQTSHGASPAQTQSSADGASNVGAQTKGNGELTHWIDFDTKWTDAKMKRKFLKARMMEICEHHLLRAVEEAAVEEDDEDASKVAFALTLPPLPSHSHPCPHAPTLALTLPPSHLRRHPPPLPSCAPSKVRTLLAPMEWASIESSKVEKFERRYKHKDIAEINLLRIEYGEEKAYKRLMNKKLEGEEHEELREEFWRLADQLIEVYGQTIAKLLKPSWVESREECELWHCSGADKDKVGLEMDGRIKDVLLGMSGVKGAVAFLHGDEGVLALTTFTTSASVASIATVATPCWQACVGAARKVAGTSASRWAITSSSSVVSRMRGVWGIRTRVDQRTMKHRMSQIVAGCGWEV